MGPLFNWQTVVVGAGLLLACDVAIREATPVASLAAAPAGETRAEKAARRAEAKAARAAKAGGAEQAGKGAKPGKGEKTEKVKGEKGEKPKGEKPATQPTQPTAKAAKVAGSRPAGGSEVTLPACPQGNALTYRSFGAGFLRTWCTGCHSSTLAASERQDAPDDVNFDRPDFYKLQEKLVYERAVLEGHKFAADPATASPMPPAGLVPSEDLRRLGQWISCGSPGV